MCACLLWLQYALQAVQGNKLQKIITEASKPLSTSVACFVHVVDFLQGAGQAQTVAQVSVQRKLEFKTDLLFLYFLPHFNCESLVMLRQTVIICVPFQCEQVEGELARVLHQRRSVLHTCLDVLHTYATIVTQVGIST